MNIHCDAKLINIEQKLSTLEEMLKKISTWMGEKEGDLTFRYSAILHTLCDIEKKLDAEQRKRDNLTIQFPKSGGGGSMGSALLGADGSPKITYVTSSPPIQEIRDLIQQLREDLLKPRVPGAYFQMRCVNGGRLTPVPCTPPPKEPRLCDTFAQFMAEPAENRAYIYYYLLSGSTRSTPQSVVNYEKYHVGLYDSPAFIGLLRDTPFGCIL